METMTQGVDRPLGKERIGRTASEAMQRGSRWWEESMDGVRRAPLQTLGMAVLAGVAVGALSAALMNRRSRWGGSFDRISDVFEDAMDKGFNGLREVVRDMGKSIGR